MLLGPRTFFTGLWLSQWSTMQEQYFLAHKDPRSTNNTCIKKLIHMTQLIPCKLWQTRNQILRQEKDNYLTELQHKELNEHIEIIFLWKPHSRTMAHCDNINFSKYDKNRILQMKLQRKQN